MSKAKRGRKVAPRTSTRSRRPGTATTLDTVLRTPTLAWHQPLCSWCHEPLEDIEHAYAGWYEREHRSFSPQIVHRGEVGCAYYHQHPNGHIRGVSVLDMPVESFRRSPMDAIMIAMRRLGDSEAERVVWHQWISIVLGLPLKATGSITELRVNAAIADVLPKRVLTVEECQELLAQG